MTRKALAEAKKWAATQADLRAYVAYVANGEASATPRTSLLARLSVRLYLAKVWVLNRTMPSRRRRRRRKERLRGKTYG